MFFLILSKKNVHMLKLHDKNNEVKQLYSTPIFVLLKTLSNLYLQSIYSKT